MKLNPYIEKLNTSKVYKDFEKKYKNSFLVAGFFILDYETGQNLNQIDYYVPSEKKVAAFTMGGQEILMQMMDTVSQKAPERLDAQTRVDLEALKGILEDEMKNRSITEEIRKIIAVIQNVKGKKTWVLSCILSGMEVLKAHIDDESETVLMMDKASVLDYLKKIPMGKAAQAQQEPTREDIDKQLEQVDKLKAALLKEKEELEKQKGKSKESPQPPMMPDGDD